MKVQPAEYIQLGSTTVLSSVKKWNFFLCAQIQTKLNETRPAIIRHLKQQILQYIQATPNDFLERIMTFQLFSNVGGSS
jgi:hypothetical protein